MKTARFLLACAAASILAACGSDSITAPNAQRSAPRNPSADETACVTVTVKNVDGTTTVVCASPSQIGSGN